MAFDQLMASVMALDLEIANAGSQIRSIGASFQGKTFVRSGRDAGPWGLQDIDNFARDAQFILGHNLLAHDLPIIKAMAPKLRILNLPVIDTLYLSPLAFPRNPYHRLVKDYKLVRSSLSDPLEDVRLALSVFRDQWESFLGEVAETPERLSVYRFCLEQGRFGEFSGRGMAEVLDRLGTPRISEISEVEEIFHRLTEGLVCRQSVQSALAEIISDGRTAPAAAYTLAWLSVAGSNSVLPPWVRHRFPAVVPLLAQLRDVPCGDAGCAYCRETHDPETQLNRFFGFDGFREKPETEEGESLQRAVVLTGLQDQPLLAIMPTGGGKSLCYQLPALVRHQRRGLLTVVISPLQALMKDQVDNLVRMTGTPFAAAIYGLLTPPERGEIMEAVRLGNIALLYISPEQLRSRSVKNVLAQREVGCWVFDEAHCLSKWGHDFRPDYLYAARFIREFNQEQGLLPAPIACYTATAKPDVMEEIIDHFDSELNQKLTLFEGGVERENLHFEIVPVNGPRKLAQAFELIQRHINGETKGCAVIYASKRKTTEEIRDYLLQQGQAAEAFHAGLEGNDKRRIIDEFTAGLIPVICATNAFGMGIDKSDIRLVLHYDIPGSLENYLQEAGRAGRDLNPAHCILLYDPNDAETQFRLGAASEIHREEIQQLLRTLKRAKRNRDNEVVITTQELLRDEDLAAVIDQSDPAGDTKIKTAVSWLERAGFLQRNQNLTQVFQGKPRINHMEEMEPIIQRLNLSPWKQRLWRGILRTLFNSPADKGLSADDIAESLFHSAEELNRLEAQTGLKPAQLVIQAMHDMAATGLLGEGVRLSAFIRYKGKNNALKVFDYVRDLEERMLSLLREESPDADDGSWVDLDINRLNQRLQNEGESANPLSIRTLVKGLSNDGRGLAGSHGSIDLRHAGRNRYRVSLRRSWESLMETAALRRNVARVILQVLVDKARKSRSVVDGESATELLVEFSTHELDEAIRLDLLLHAKVQKRLAAIDRALLFLHEHKIITLQHGLAVFRQAMTIRLNAGSERRRYSTGDFKPLAIHYGERRFQVHVIMEYATLAMDKIARALRLVLDYFSLPRDRFVRQYFAGREEILKRATGAESYRLIVEALHNPVQIEIVGSPIHANMLILAGPGSGKTRVVVHRCAYLLRVERIAASRILVMCFNYHAAVSIRKRLNELVGSDSRGVTVVTYHGAAMRLAGISPAELMTRRGMNGIDFDGMIRDAVALLKGEKEVPGLSADDVRELILQGFSHILVDEYQDIDEDQYELVSAIAGRTREEGDGRLSILAVGDDDQNIYAFRGANVAFLKRFEADFRSESRFMVENYRSTAHIIEVANQLIRQNRDRMKGNHPIRVNRERLTEPGGGPWEEVDPLGRGCVQILAVKNFGHQVAAVFHELTRLKSLKPDLDWNRVAVLTRTHDVTGPLRAALETGGIPVRRNLTSGLPLHRIREVNQFLRELTAIETDIRMASELERLLPKPALNGIPSPWSELVRDLLSTYQEETADAPLPVNQLIDRIYEALVEKRRDRTIGRGVFLNTIHAVKGLEFDHVLIPDGDWRNPQTAEKREEERRLYYVGMTRAKETLCLFEMDDGANSFAPGLEGDRILRRPGAFDDELSFHSSAHYEILALGDIHIGFAATFPPGHSLHATLSTLGAGDPVRLVRAGDAIDIRTLTGTTVCRLSKEAVKLWMDRVTTPLDAVILGMLRRFADDGDPTFKRFCKVDTWEVPLVEIRFSNVSSPAQHH